MQQLRPIILVELSTAMILIVFDGHHEAWNLHQRATTLNLLYQNILM